MRAVPLVLIGLLVAFCVAVLVASEFGGEVVTLATTDPEGREYRTSLWIIEDGGALFLRAGSRDSRWYRRLAERRVVRLERGGQTRRYRAVPEPELTARVDALMAYHYGIADWLVGLIRNPDESMAVRLDPL